MVIIIITTATTMKTMLQTWAGVGVRHPVELRVRWECIISMMDLHEFNATSTSVRVCMCPCLCAACVLNQLLFWLRIKTADRKCEAKGQIIGPY